MRRSPLTAATAGGSILDTATAGSEIGRRRQHDPVLAERRHDVLDVAQEGRRRPDEEDRAGQAGPLGVQQVRGPVERHRRLAGAGRPLDDRHAGAGATDHDVLLRLDRGHHVLHAAGPRRVERRQQRALADEGQTGLARGADVEHLVVEPDQLAVAPAEVASPHHTHGVVRQRPVERLGGGRPPVDDERITVFVRDGQATHVQAAAVDEVEAADEQPVLRDVERGQPAAGVGDGAVALEQRLRVPRLGEPPRRPGQPLGRAPHGHDAVVGGVEVGALPVQLVVTMHGAIVAADAIGSKRADGRKMRPLRRRSATSPPPQK